MQPGSGRGDGPRRAGEDGLVAFGVARVGGAFHVGRQGHRAVEVEVDHVIEADDPLAVGEDCFDRPMDPSHPEPLRRGRALRPV